MKVGVDPKRDADYLLEDYRVDVSNTLDLRYMAEAADCQPGGLAKMAENYFKVKPYKQNWRFHYMWEKPNLTPQQIDYAAKDAHIGIELFKFFAGKLQSKVSQTLDTLKFQPVIDEYCVTYFDINYVNKDNNTENNQGHKNNQGRPKKNQRKKKKQK